MTLLYDIFDADPQDGRLLAGMDAGVPLGPAPDHPRYAIARPVNGDGPTLYGYAGGWVNVPPSRWTAETERREAEVRAAMDARLLHEAGVRIGDATNGDRRVVTVRGRTTWLDRADALAAAAQDDPEGARLYQAVARSCGWMPR